MDASNFINLPANHRIRVMEPRMVFLSSNTVCLFLEFFLLLTRSAAGKTFAWENIMVRDRRR